MKEKEADAGKEGEVQNYGESFEGDSTLAIIELLGIAQICDIDNLFYICIRHVKVRGRPLSPAFGVQNIEPSGDFVLKYTRRSLIHVVKLV
ncbi:hypothetical protein HAX54_045420 [Datura stramonium]|uniref:Uncharacterized protein n=1 Tax=Datura stramonium TaxID=4076 RepID=A0ABS8SQI5_DATST|nr:hypothetical protein [Datura stramonium]